MFFTENEQSLIDQYTSKGYIVEAAASNKDLSWIRKKFVEIAKEELDIVINLKDEEFLNLIHKFIPVQDFLNSSDKCKTQ